MEQTPASGEVLPFATFLRRHREELIDEWAARLASRQVGARLTPPQRRDHMPHVLACLADVVEGAGHGAEGQPFRRLSAQHALDRLDVGFDLPAVILEYGLLREVVVERFAPWATGANFEELDAFHHALDEAMRIAAERFAQARERTLLALQRASDAALASEHPESFVRRVLEVMVETAEAADFAAVMLLEDDRLVTRVAVGIEEAATGAFSVRLGEGFAGRVALAGEPRELRNAATDPMVISTYVRRRGAKALYCIPMYEGERLLGVAKVGSISTEEFSRDDKLLFQEMASRVAAVLAHAGLREREREQRERAEVALARLDALIEAVPAGIAFLDPDLRYLVVNEKLARDNGQPARAHIGRTVQEVVPRSIREALLPSLQRVAQEGVPVRAVPLKRERDGGTRELLTHLVPVKTASGRLLGVGALVTDVTEQVAAERRLRESEAQLRAAVEGVSDYAIMLIDSQGRVASWNPGGERLKGYTAEEVLGRSIAIFLQGRDVTRAEAQLRIAREQGRFEEEAPRVRKDGSVFWAHVVIRPRISASGQVEGYVEVCSDVTARRRAAEERERLLQELDRQQRTLKGVLDQLPVGVAVAVPPRGELVLGNRAFERVWRMPFVFAREVAGYEAYPGFRADGTPLRPEEWPLARALRGELVEEEEVEIRRGDGTRGTLLLSATPIRDAEGGLIAAVVTAMDVTERKAALAELERTAHFRETFIGIVSHDLRTPVSAIALSSEMLLAGPLGERERRLAERIARSNDRIARMIRDLLDFTSGRLGGGIPLDLGPADLERICRAVVEELEGSRPGRVVKLEAEGALDGEWDADRLQQAVGNLAKNAVDYSPADEPVLLKLGGDADFVTIEVRNGGEPIPPEALPTLFEPFRRGEGAQRAERSGLGLGLYIVRMIAEAHQGSLSVRSSREAGTVFTLTLPRHPSHP